MPFFDILLMHILVCASTQFDIPIHTAISNGNDP